MMAYTQKKMMQNIEYAKLHKKRIPLDVQKEYYENVLKPAAEKAGEPVNSFIKKAIAQRIAREGLQPKQKYLIHTTGYDLFATYDGMVAKWKTVDSSADLDSVTDDSGWDSETVDNFDEFFGIGNGAEILAQAAF